MKTYTNEQDLKGYTVLTSGKFGAIEVNDATIPAEIVGEIFEFGLKKKLQNEYAGYRGDDHRGLMEDMLATFAAGYFTHAAKKSAENPTPQKGGSGGTKTLDSQIFVEVLNTMEESDRAIAQGLPRGKVLESFEENKPDIYQDCVKKAKKTLDNEAKAKEKEVEAFIAGLK